MGASAKSAATRQRIIDAAVDLFSKFGYGDTGVSTIAARAEITTGAFYYHFDSKEALGRAIIEQSWPHVWDVVAHFKESRSPGLEKVIAMTFAISDVMKRDKLVWLGHHLNQAFAQLGEDARLAYEKRASGFIDTTSEIIRDANLRDDITAEEMCSQIWMNINGCHMLSEAMADSAIARMGRSWLTLLRATVPAQSLPYFEQFVTRTASQYE